MTGEEVFGVGTGTGGATLVLTADTGGGWVFIGGVAAVFTASVFGAVVGGVDGKVEAGAGLDTVEGSSTGVPTLTPVVPAWVLLAVLGFVDVAAADAAITCAGGTSTAGGRDGGVGAGSVFAAADGVGAGFVLAAAVAGCAVVSTLADVAAFDVVTAGVGGATTAGGVGNAVAAVGLPGCDAVAAGGVFGAGATAGPVASIFAGDTASGTISVSGGAATDADDVAVGGDAAMGALTSGVADGAGDIAVGATLGGEADVSDFLAEAAAAGLAGACAGGTFGADGDAPVATGFVIAAGDPVGFVFLFGSSELAGFALPVCAGAGAAVSVCVDAAVAVVSCAGDVAGEVEASPACEAGGGVEAGAAARAAASNNESSDGVMVSACRRLGRWPATPGSQARPSQHPTSTCWAGPGQA
jgi:hypothetical protein